MAIKPLWLFVLLSFLSVYALAESSGSVVFFDAPKEKFIRSNLLSTEDQGKIFSMDEVVSAVSVLLGSAPGSLSVESSNKLNEVIFPNPFDKPRAIFLVEISGIQEPLLSSAYSSGKVGNSFHCILGSAKADLRSLVNVNQISVIPLDENLSAECDAACVGRELTDLGVFVNGKLTFPLVDGSSLTLNIAKRADYQFVRSLVSLVSNVHRVLEDHEIFVGSRTSQDLLVGRFTGIEVLKEEYGQGDTVQKGIELVQTALVKSFVSLQKSYEGKVVGVIVSNPSANPGHIVELAARESRWLVEESTSANTTLEGIPEVLLVRQSLAWITGIILLVSALLGTYFLLYMPLTRDTLLYSNVKLE